jgi:hypothetical protein
VGYCQLLERGPCVCWCLGSAYLVEVDVHALELEVRRAVVPANCQLEFCARCQLVYAYTPEPSRPCSPEMVCQKAAPIWLPFADVNHKLFHSIGYGMVDIHTGRSGGEPMRKMMVSYVVFCSQTRGARVVFQGTCLAVGERAVRTISRMVGVLGVVRVGVGWRCRDVVSGRRGEVGGGASGGGRGVQRRCEDGKGRCLASGKLGGSTLVGPHAASALA